MNKQAGSSVSKTQEKYLLQSYDLINQIISRKIGKLHFDSIEDVRQQVFLKLWRWKSHRGDRELSEEEWKKLANTAAHNAVNDFFSQINHQTVLFSQMDDGSEEVVLSAQSIQSNNANNNNSEGNSPLETGSLLQLIWKLMQSLTLRQRYAYLFHQPDFLIDFISYECCSMKELADYFEIERAELLALIELIPLPEETIAGLLERKLTKEKKIPVRNVWKARSEAKKKLARQLAEFINNGRPSDGRGT